MRVIGTVGMPGSGKGEFSEVAEAEGVPVVNMGDVIRAETRERGLDPAEDHGQVAQDLRAEHGDDVVAQRTLPLIEGALEEADTVLVDGLRAPVEADTFRERFGDDFLIVAVEASFDTREERLLGRGRDRGEPLAERDERELGWGMGEVIDRADVTVDNDGRPLDAYREAVRALLRGDHEGHPAVSEP